MGILTGQKAYTIKDWKKDGELSPQLFQEVDHEVYSDMYCVLPPYQLEKVTQKILESQLGIKFVQAFCVGEEYDQDDDGNYLYKSFGKTADGKCFYLGLRRSEY